MTHPTRQQYNEKRKHPTNHADSMHNSIIFHYLLLGYQITKLNTMKKENILFIPLILCMTAMFYAMYIRDIHLFAVFEIATLINIIILIINLNKQK